MLVYFKRYSPLLIISLSIAACDGFESNELLKSLNKAQSLVCYTGVEAEACYPTFDLKSRVSDPSDYAYKNPRSNPEFPTDFNVEQYIKPLYFIDLREVNEKDQLSEHFKLGEFMSLRKGELGLFSTEVVEFMQLIRNELDVPLFVTSGYRNPTYNESVGGARWSRHQYGDAVDFSLEDKNFNLVKEKCLNLGAAFYQIYENHIHCDWRAHPLNKEFYGPVRTPKFQSVSKIIANNSRIIVREAANEQLIISAEISSIEDNPDELVYEWVLRTGPEEFSYKNPTLIIQKPPHALRIELTVGGSIVLKKSWP